MNESIYYLLGHVDNYSEGFSSNEVIFKRISFLNFDWKVDNELIRKSNRLLKMCEVILKENKLPNDIHIEKWEENKGITIISNNIVSLVNNFVNNKSEWLGRESLEMNKGIFDEFEIWKTNSKSHKQRLNFLHGVIDSNGNENEFYFYNGYYKCLLTQYVLRCFADEDDQITMNSYFKTPWVDKLIIDKKGNLWKKIIKKYCS